MRKSLVPAGALACALVLAACGGEDNGEAGEEGQPPEEAPEQAPEAEEPSTPPPDGEAQELAAEVLDSTLDEETAQFDLDMDFGPEDIDGDGAVSFGEDASDIQMTMEAEGQEFEVRVVDGATFVQVPEELGEQLGIEEDWIESGEDEQAGGPLDELGQIAGPGDPTEALTQIEEAGTISDSEDTEINDEEVTVHSIDIEFEHLTESFPPGLPAEAAPQLQQQGVQGYQIDLAVDEDNRPAQITTDLSPLLEEVGQQAPEGEEAEEAVVEVTYSEWGEEVDIEAPPEDDIGEMPMPEQQPGQPQPGEPQPGQPQPGEEPQPGQPQPGQPQPGEPQPGQPQPGEEPLPEPGE